MTLWQINLLPWYFFLIYFGLSALRVKATKVHEEPGKRLLHVGPMVLSALLLFSHSLRIGPLGARFVPALAIVEYLGVALTFFGVAFAIWARYSLGQYWSSRVTLKVDHKLIRTGPYGYIRHPLYTGLLLGVLGTALVVGEWRAVAAVFLALGSFWRKASTEESLLLSEFKDEYAEYRRHTGFLTPKFR